ncbi:MAG TPA: thioredoxin family protein [Planctomycetia bacterium]|nr:thioredoxin family protein [Planctomycetia bacterium]
MLSVNLVLSLALAGSPAADEKSAIKWAKDFDAAVKEAKEAKKVVMVDFYTDWCGWCKVLDEKTYSDEKVGKYAAANLVSVKVDAENKDGGEKLAKKYKVDGFPTILFLDGDEVVGKVGGFMPPEPFLKKVEGYMAVHKELPGLKKQLESSPDDKDLNLKVLKLVGLKGDVDQMQKIVKKLDSLGAKPDEIGPAYNDIGDALQTDGQFPAAIEMFKKAEASSDANVKVYAISSIAACHLSSRNLPKAKAEADRALEVKGASGQVLEDAKKLKEQIDVTVKRQAEMKKKFDEMLKKKEEEKKKAETDKAKKDA